jgi:2-oxoisovalerate dehydrogenase E2 component (dihydrolipoyl transacylase)
VGIAVFKLPDIGEGIAESEIALWRVSVGDVISEDQPLVDMLTDKAAVEIPSPIAGKVIRLHGETGDKVAVGAALVTLETEADAATSAEVAQSAGTGAEQRSETPQRALSAARQAESAPPSTAAPAASPAVRKRARELGIDLRDLKGSGPSGRIVREDLELRSRPPQGSATVIPEKLRVAVEPDQAVGPDDTIEQVKVIGLRRKIADAMQRSAQRIPHFAYVEEVDVTDLEALRNHLNQTKSDGPKLTLLPLIIQALVRAVPLFPMVNATFDDEAGVVTRYRSLHVGIATQTAAGLVVPVLKNAHSQDVWQRAFNIKRLAHAARSGKAAREDLSGSTITLSSLGALGGVVTTPIINAPEVAIIGINKMIDRPVVRHDQITVRTMMNLSSSFDHRIVDGFDAASFVRKMKDLLENPATLFIEPPHGP